MYKMDDIEAKRLHNAEYMRQYIKRKKIEVLNTREFRNSKKQLLINNKTKVPKEIPKTTAERIRECRNRKKQLLSNNETKVPKEIPKTTAERIRECRIRRKQLLSNNETKVPKETWVGIMTLIVNP
ncbi:hypothetical protein L798_04632 [Zootermopsis nevadensis]|uniref:Uncharacterized protein n=1 Tax=Zootermopsis nevadensis TaxID=136037 RepID=A0A067RN77_ZOONE|nr:hypothetical protein L798_04632 [Zootermopsis nevadensis]